MRWDGSMAVDEKGTRLTLTIEVNEKWAEPLNREDLVETLKNRVEFALGFGGQGQEGEAEGVGAREDGG